MSERWKLSTVFWMNKILRRFGYSIQPHIAYSQIWGDSYFSKAEALAAPYTMIGEARLWSLMDAVAMVVDQKISGDIVECGVWRGGAMLAAAKVLFGKKDFSRLIWLYDTFEGLPQPDDRDVSILHQSAITLWKQRLAGGQKNWCRAELAEVRSNISKSSYPQDRFRFVKGLVESSIPSEIPDQIAILRLDLDWYKPTKHALEHLFPRLAPNGILIIDDYGHWAGAKQAVDEFLAKHNLKLWLMPVDYTCRIAQVGRH